MGRWCGKQKCFKFTSNYLSNYLSPVKFLCMVAGFVISYCFQSKWTEQPDIYYTDDPLDTVRNGVQYHCGCNLPGPLQTAQDSHRNSSSTWNTCYDTRQLETITVLMYPNFTGVDRLEKILNHTYLNKLPTLQRTKVVPGVDRTVQAHDVVGAQRKFNDFVSQLYPGGYQQQAWFVDVKKLVYGNSFWDFPESYLTMTFAYDCYNCKSCKLSAVNDIFRQSSGDDTQSALWGQCVYWGRGDQCSSNNSYEAKCGVYPEIAPVPLVFGIQQFFEEFFALGDTSDVYPPFRANGERINTFTANRNRNRTSLKPYELYLDLSQVRPGMVNLSFMEIEKVSIPWVLLLDQYPSLDTQCSEMKNVEYYSGSTVCNVHRNAVTRKFEHKCSRMTNETECRDTVKDMSIDNVLLPVWEIFNLGPFTQGFAPGPADYEELLCQPYRPSEMPPYFVLNQTAPVMQDDILNQFLETNVLKDIWARESGVCTETYTDVIRLVENGSTDASAKYMEVNCSQIPQSNYCWLTGRYTELTHTPQDSPLVMNLTARAKNTFVCYVLAEVSVVKWFIVTFGIIFGWLGTIDLVFNWIKRCSRLDDGRPSNELETGNLSTSHKGDDPKRRPDSTSFKL